MVAAALECELLDLSIVPEVLHKKWRNVLLHLEARLQQDYPGASICGPFGFELICNADVAPKKIRKFYIYSNNPCKLNRDLYASKIQKITFELIRQLYPEIYNHFVLFVRNECMEHVYDVDYVANEWDKLLDIQVRDTEANILEDYANYIILVYQSFLDNVGEATYFASAHYRGRMLQLLVIIRALYDDYIPEGQFLSLEDTISECLPFVDNHIQIFCDKSWWKSTPITPKEVELIQGQLLPLCQYIQDVINKSAMEEEKIRLEVECFHDASCSTLAVHIGGKLYTRLLDKACCTYNHFV